MAEKVLTQNAGSVVEKSIGIVTSAGSGDSGKLPALDGSGRLDATVMPSGVGATTKSILASEALAAGDLVNVYNNSGTPNVRKADASANKPVNGFVLAAVSSGANATVYASGVNNQLTSLTPGTPYFLSGSTPGAITSTAPSTSGYLVQRVGTPWSATELPLEKHLPITLA